MTITLAQETKERLREHAAQDNQNTDPVANETPAESLRPAEADIKAFHEALLASGLVKRIARRSEPDLTERHLIQVQGELLSETIIRERR